MNDNNRNFILAIVLSIGVLLVWQFFIVGPQMDKARQQQDIAAQQTPADDDHHRARHHDHHHDRRCGTSAAGRQRRAPRQARSRRR